MLGEIGPNGHNVLNPVALEQGDGHEAVCRQMKMNVLALRKKVNNVEDSTV